MATITIAATDQSGSFNAYLAEPAKTPAGAVVVIQEIFGVNPSLRATCDQIADMGFLALAPDLFWRLEPNVSLTDKTEAEWQKAFDLMKRFDQDRGVEDLQATLTAARRLPGCNGRAGTIGYCLGGRLAALMAIRSDADVNIGYYGVGLDQLIPDMRGITRPLLLHIAELDTYMPPEARERVVEAAHQHTHMRAFVYAGADHAFARVGGQHWNGLAATIANGRSAEALAAALA